MDGQRVEGPWFPIGLTGTPGYFVSTPTESGDMQIAGQEKNYIGKNIRDYGSGFAYGDFQFSLPKEEIIGTALPTIQNYLVMIGDTASYTSLGLNVVSMGCTFVGAFPVAGTFSSAAAVMGFVAFGAYSFAGCSEKACWAFASVFADLVPFMAPDLKAAYNPVAQRFINDTTKRFIPTTVGLTKYYSFPAIGVGLGISSNLIGE